MKKVLFVCIANYCRSPVAEKIMSAIDENNSYDSCGMHPLIGSTMDPRSANFLRSKKIDDVLHVPKKITLDLVEENDLIIAMDFIILNNLLAVYKNHSEKFKAFTYVDNKNIISDPYKYSDEEYNSIMLKIYDSCGKWKTFL